jgi:AraC-like DNA-binding protein
MLYFSPELARSLTDEIAQGGNREYEFESPVLRDAGVARLFLMLFRSLTAQQSMLSEVFADQTLLLLFSRIARPGEPVQEPRAPRGVEIAQELIDDDPAFSRSLDDLAAVSGLSRFQLVRGFTRKTGLTPHAYIVQRRLLLARRLISGGHTLADAAAACGFSDQSHMTRLFRRTFGISPSAYAQATSSMA